MADGPGGGRRKPGPSQKVLQRPENRLCADCGARDPRWSSVNLGIFICEVCAGIHRSLGTHISKVKSVTLDEWKDEWVEMVESVGNARARAFYEHAVPKEERYISGAARIQGADRVNKATALLLERWIRAKYEEKRYAPPGAQAPSAPSRRRAGQWPAFEQQWPDADSGALPAPAAFAAFPASPAGQAAGRPAAAVPAEAGPWPDGFAAPGAGAGVPAAWQREGPVPSAWPGTAAEASSGAGAGAWPEAPAGAWPGTGGGTASWPPANGTSAALSFDGASPVRHCSEIMGPSKTAAAAQKQPEKVVAVGTVGCFPCRFAARRSSMQRRTKNYGRGGSKDTEEEKSLL